MDCFKKLFGGSKPAPEIKPDPEIVPQPAPIKPSNLHQEMADLYYRCTIRPERLNEVQRICAKIRDNRGRYQAIEIKTGVPWYAIGAIHHKEASLDFRAYLGNGQLIIGTGKKSTIVPIGRGPFSSFEEGAIEALGNQKGKDWSLGNLLYFLEGYNGFGYRAHGINTPYLYAATTAYSKGGYPRDHFFDPNHVVKNPGCAAIFKGLSLF